MILQFVRANSHSILNDSFFLSNCGLRSIKLCYNVCGQKAKPNKMNGIRAGTNYLHSAED